MLSPGVEDSAYWPRRCWVSGLRLPHGLSLTNRRKSQLAIEYTHQVRSESPTTWVLWVYASNAARFEQSFRDIADQVKISGRQDPRANIFNLVENWLRDEKRGRWVLILDNVDDHEFLCKSPVTGQGDPKNCPTNVPTKPLLEYLPRSLNGSVILTSRTREVALRIVDYKDLIEIKPLERSEALELLQRKLQQPGEIQESRQLVEELELMPLAIVQAASYIRNRAPRCSVSQYLRDFQKSDREAIKLLKIEAGHLYRDWEAKSSILVTWQMSFDHIRQTKRSAADLLSLMSFFDRQGISENLLRVQLKSSDSSGFGGLNDSSDDMEVYGSDAVDDFEDDITTLRDFSFISVGKNSGFFTMHRLVQLSTYIWLKIHGQTELWKERFINSLYYRFPTGEFENWGTCQLLFPHVKAAILQRPESPESLRKWATLLYNGAWYASQRGFVADVRNMASRSREQRISLLGAEHEEALSSTAMLAMAWSLEGYWENAEELFMQVVKTSKTELGEDHPSTLTSMANLASTYSSQGRWEEAEQLDVQVIKASKTKLGEDYPSTLISMANLALTYLNQGRWEEAEKLFMQVIKTSKTKLGEDHPSTLSSMANLASTYGNQGRWEEAEQLFVQVIKSRKIKLGEDHPSTLSSMANLASTYLNQGREEEAEKLFVQVIKTSKTKLGEDHPDTLISIANLASTYWK
jgi:tetratricopeptide (TPR) repeat protein